jgi:hypothetical protein
MRKLSSLAIAAMFAATAFATPASAQNMQASGSCGPAAGQYGYTDVNSSMVNTETQSVPGLFYVVNYSGVPAPTTVGVIVRLNGELESQVGVASFTAANAGGSFEGALRANIDPSAQGFNNSVSKNTGNPGGSNNAPGTDTTRHGSKDGPLDHELPGGNGVAGGNGSATQGGLGPGEYVFYIYTGERKDVYNVKDGTVALNTFVADEKGFLGWFSCGVSTDQGSGPG